MVQHSSVCYTLRILIQAWPNNKYDKIKHEVIIINFIITIVSLFQPIFLLPTFTPTSDPGPLLAPWAAEGFCSALFLTTWNFLRGRPRVQASWGLQVFPEKDCQQLEWRYSFKTVMREKQNTAIA